MAIMILERLRLWFRDYFYTDFLPYWRYPNFIFQASISFFLLYLASIINSLAGINATEHAGNPTTDIILSNTTRLDTSFIHGWLSGFIKDLTLLFLFFVPRYFPFAVKSAAFLMIVRAIFINLTNIGMFPDSIPVNSLATYGGDLFFSGHVAFAYMNALVFWDNKFLRNIFLCYINLKKQSHTNFCLWLIDLPFVYGIWMMEISINGDIFDWQLIVLLRKKI